MRIRPLGFGLRQTSGSRCESMTGRYLYFEVGGFSWSGGIRQDVTFDERTPEYIVSGLYIGGGRPVSKDRYGSMGFVARTDH